MESTLLSTIIARMQRWTSILPTEEQLLVYDLDEALRAVKRDHMLPWTLQKSTLKVFGGIFEYPVPAGFDTVAILSGQEKTFNEKAKPYYTSIKEFYEDPLNRSAMAMIWDNGSQYLGIRNNNIADNKQIIDPIEDTTTDYTLSQDATAVLVDESYYSDSDKSTRITVVNTLGVATVSRIFSTTQDVNYKRKYYFRKIFLNSVPTNIILKYGKDSSNYLYKTITAQFSGQAFKANAWNIVAIDLSSASEIGTQDENFSFEEVSITGLPSGYFYLDQSFITEWSFMDFWYYSDYMVMTLGNVVANQPYFMDDNNVYSTDSALVCPAPFVDVIMYDAMITSITDRENSKIYPIIDAKRQRAWDSLLEDYPSLEPLIQTNYWTFGSSVGSSVIQSDEI